MTSRSNAEKLLEVKKRLNIAIAKLKEVAQSCIECDGTGLHSVKPQGQQGHIEHCQECLDIREAIEDLELPL